MSLLITRCTTCSGRKKTLQLGGIYKDCKPCKGIGYTESQINPAENINIEVLAGSITVDNKTSTIPKQTIKPKQRKPKTITKLVAIKPPIDLTTAN